MSLVDESIVNYDEYLLEVSTYNPPNLDGIDQTILSLIAQKESTSVYQVFKDLTESSPSYIKRGLDYTNVLKRIKRFEEFKLIDRLKKHFERGAIHYKVTTYGLISCLTNDYLPFIDLIIKQNKDNIVIKTLILQLFENATLDSLDYYFIEDYIRSCCIVTNEACYNWTYLYPVLSDILPSDNIIKQYMAHLMNKKIENKESVLKDIELYNKKLQRKIKESGMERLAEAVEQYEDEYFKEPYAIQKAISSSHLKDEKPPYPFLNLYGSIISYLSDQLERKLRSLSFEVVYFIGTEIVHDFIENIDPRELDDDSKKFEIPENPYLEKNIKTMINDPKFNKIISVINRDYDVGREQFKKGIQTYWKEKTADSKKKKST